VLAFVFAVVLLATRFSRAFARLRQAQVIRPAVSTSRAPYS